MCAIERHPDSSTRDSLTHTLFNLIKRPDEKQRRIIMDVKFLTTSNNTWFYYIFLVNLFKVAEFFVVSRPVLLLLRMWER